MFYTRERNKNEIINQYYLVLLPWVQHPFPTKTIHGIRLIQQNTCVSDSFDGIIENKKPIVENGSLIWFLSLKILRQLILCPQIPFAFISLHTEKQREREKKKTVSI